LGRTRSLSSRNGVFYLLTSRLRQNLNVVWADDRQQREGNEVGIKKVLKVY
jgi:hypothetical protein